MGSEMCIRDRHLTSLKVCDWSGLIFGASANPRPLQKMAMSPSSIVHGGQHDTKYVTFEFLMHAAFVVDGIWGFMPEPARSSPWACSKKVGVHLCSNSTIRWGVDLLEIRSNKTIQFYPHQSLCL